MTIIKKLSLGGERFGRSPPESGKCSARGVPVYSASTSLSPGFRTGRCCQCTPHVLASAQGSVRDVAARLQPVWVQSNHSEAEHTQPEKGLNIQKSNEHQAQKGEHGKQIMTRPVKFLFLIIL